MRILGSRCFGLFAPRGQEKGGERDGGERDGGERKRGRGERMRDEGRTG
jgi:hypothetical protein